MTTHVIQFATGKYSAQLDLTFDTHSTACARHNYVFRVSNTQTNPRHPYWEKPYLAKQAVEAGADLVVWLDADTLWTGDLPLNPPLTSIIGCTYHTGFGRPLDLMGIQPVYDHYNAGVFYLDAIDKEKATKFLDKWISEQDDNHSWHDQHSLNKLIIKDPSLVTKLPMEWNSVEHNPAYRSPNPVVRAWHGGGGPDRVLSLMKTAISNLSK